MIIILFLIPISILVAAGFLGAFIWAVRSGQYEDTCTPAMRILADETAITPVAASRQSAALFALRIPTDESAVTAKVLEANTKINSDSK